MSEGSAAIGRIVRAGLAGWAPGVRGGWLALAAGAVLSLAPGALPPGAALLGLVLEFAAATLAYGALYRAAFDGPRGWLGLRWGQEEWRLLAVQLLITAVVTVMAAVAFVIIGAAALGVARAQAPNFDATSAEAWRQALSGPAGLLPVLVTVLSLAAMAWAGLRLALAPAATVARGRLQVLSAFGLTRGATAALFVAGVVLFAPAIILAVALGYARALIGLPGGGPLGQGLSVGLLFFYLIPVWTAALVDVYRRQAGSDAVAGNTTP